MVLNTTLNTGRDQQQQMPTQMPQLLTQSPQANSDGRMETPALMLPPGPHRPLTPRMPLHASPTSSSQPLDPLFKEDKYSSTSEEETSGRRNNIYPRQKPAQRDVRPQPNDQETNIHTNDCQLHYPG